MSKRIRFVIDTDKDTHKMIKGRALERNISIRDYILQAIAEKIVREDTYQNKELYEH